MGSKPSATTNFGHLSFPASVRPPWCVSQYCSSGVYGLYERPSWDSLPNCYADDLPPSEQRSACLTDCAFCANYSHSKTACLQVYDHYSLGASEKVDLERKLAVPLWLHS